MTARLQFNFRSRVFLLALSVCISLSLLSECHVVHAQQSVNEDLGLKVPEGFTITRFAGDELAHDIYSMTIDSLGRVVVSGAGYVKILIDDNQDGVADRAQLYAPGPEQGAQGMFFVGRDLICSGGEGLIRYRDRDGNDQADGPPDTFLHIKTGHEHDLHAIRKGPDGWWYLIAGNTAGVNPQYAALTTSPVRKPHAGVILRMKPDLSQGEIFAHGFRNAYDFDFHASGELFAFDSDGENVKSLPWYQPTKLFHVIPGSHQGWVSNNWIRPDNLFDSAPVVSSFGRGSPTGVTCYQHSAFPEMYRGALFVQDWTFGRVYAVLMRREGSSWAGQQQEFVTTTGQQGFAPTDIEVGPAGEIYVCVGGRGTHGGVYCIRPVGQGPAAERWPGKNASPTTQAARLDLCLQAPQPLSSWSRHIWEPIAKDLTKADFIQAAADQSRNPQERIRAIEILTEKFQGLDDKLAAQLAADAEPIIRARAVWALGRTRTENPNRRLLEPFVGDTDPIVIRNVMEAAQGGDAAQLEDFTRVVGQQLANPDRLVRQAAMRVLIRASQPTVHKMAEVAFRNGWEASVPVAASSALRGDTYSPYAVDIAVRILKGNNKPGLKLEAARLLQMGLGDVAPTGDDVIDVFAGYSPRIDLSGHAAAIEKIRIELAAIYPTKHPDVDWELERAIAMVNCNNADLLDSVLSQITTRTNPIDDIHRLIVTARMPGKRTPVQTQFIAQAIVNLESKIHARQLQQDSAWSDRIMEMCAAQIEHAPGLPVAMMHSPNFGSPGHVQFVQLLPEDQLDTCAAIFLRHMKNDPNYAWNPDLVFMLSAVETPEIRALLRSKFDDLSLRNAILTSCASDPQEQDRKLFVTGLQTGTVETMLLCIEALHVLNASTDGMENVVLARTLRKLGDSGEERQARDQTIELLRRNLRQSDTYILGKDDDPQPAPIAQWLTVVEQRFPKEFAATNQTDAQSLDQLASRLAGINWNSGHVANGAKLFQSRSCAQCHGQSGALGPDLTGVTGRFSRDDLFTAIVFPSQDVPLRYQGIQIVTTTGHIRSGMIVYEGLDGLVIRDANYQTYRIEADEIEEKHPMRLSLMPAGLLNGLTDQEFSDLYAYLRSLGAKSTAATSDANTTR